MRATIQIVTDDGKQYSGQIDLLERPQSRPEIATSSETTAVSASSLNYSLPARAFMKKYAQKMTGPAKSTLLAAHMTAGKVGGEIKRSEVEEAWNKMTEILGGRFNGAYTNRAKDNGWLDSPKTGVYVLLDGWTEILSQSGA